MCVVSLVMDYYRPRIDEWWFQPLTPSVAPSVMKEISDLKKAVQGAEDVDRLTGQPDCVDPEKAKLMERVAALEAAVSKLSRRRKRRKRK